MCSVSWRYWRCHSDTLNTILRDERHIWAGVDSDRVYPRKSVVSLVNCHMAAFPYVEHSVF